MNNKTTVHNILSAMTPEDAVSSHLQEKVKVVQRIITAPTIKLTYLVRRPFTDSKQIDTDVLV